MKKLIAALLCTGILFPSSAGAFELVSVREENVFLDTLERDIQSDILYLKDIAFSYSDRYVVTEAKTADISGIDELYAGLSAPVSVTELDNGDLSLDTGHIWSDTYGKKMNAFKMFAGLCGYSAQFEPVAYFNIYRNITLVGGYVNYKKQYEDPNDAYWQYITAVEEMTKEVIPYETRIKILEKITELSEFMDSDKSFKIFILADGRVDSSFERM